MNAIAAIFCIRPVDSFVDSFLPRITAIIDDVAKAAIVPIATEIGALCSTANAIAASCVLSPSSATNTSVNIVKNILVPVFFIWLLFWFVSFFRLSIPKIMNIDPATLLIMSNGMYCEIVVPTIMAIVLIVVSAKSTAKKT